MLFMVPGKTRGPIIHSLGYSCTPPRWLQLTLQECEIGTARRYTGLRIIKISLEIPVGIDSAGIWRRRIAEEEQRQKEESPWALPRSGNAPWRRKLKLARSRSTIR